MAEEEAPLVCAGAPSSHSKEGEPPAPSVLRSNWRLLQVEGHLVSLKKTKAWGKQS